MLTECQWETKPNERIWVVYVEGEFYGEVSPRKWVQLQRNSVEEEEKDDGHLCLMPPDWSAEVGDHVSLE